MVLPVEKENVKRFFFFFFFIGKRFLAFSSHELMLFGENCFLILILFGMDHKKRGRGGGYRKLMS